MFSASDFSETLVLSATPFPESLGLSEGIFPERISIFTIFPERIIERIGGFAETFFVFAERISDICRDFPESLGLSEIF